MCQVSYGDNPLEADEYGVSAEQILKIISNVSFSGNEDAPTPSGISGFSPIVEVKTDTEDEYVLHITDKNSEYDTPNLKGAVGPQGEKGEQGEIGPQGPKGEDGTISFEDLTEEQKESLKGEIGPAGKDGEQGPQGIQGEKGEDGYTPIKGTDYFTDEDIESIVAAVTAQFIDGEEGEY
jgi:hypothetical protein